MSKIFCFGELLLRMSPVLNRQWIRDHKMPVYVGGAELNVATALAKWELPVKYMTSLPENSLAEEIVADIIEKGIDASSIYYTGERVGIYYLPQGADLKNAGVIYDRSNTAFASLKPGMINWEAALEGCTWFHFSAISPALSEDIAAVCKEALEVAVKKGLTISVDLNYRAKLWKYGKKPVEVMPELVSYCDLVMGNIWSAEALLGVKVGADIESITEKYQYAAQAHHTSQHLFDFFPACKTVANTFRFAKGSSVEYYACLDTKTEQSVSNTFTSEKIIDQVGSGDCFMGGLIYGFSKNMPSQQIINYAAAAAFGKLHELGDHTNQTVEQIKISY